MRKEIKAVDEANVLTSLTNRRIMNDIMYYLRKLLKLARRAQTSLLREGYDMGDDIEIQECLKEVREAIKDLEDRVG